MLDVLKNFFADPHQLNVYLAAALALSEALALIPQLKANSILQLVIGGLKKVLSFFSSEQPKA